MGRMSRTLAGVGVVVTFFALSQPLWAAATNRVYIKNQQVRIGDKGVIIPVYIDSDAPALVPPDPTKEGWHGFSIALKFDQTKLSVPVPVMSTAGTESAGADWSNGQRDAAGGKIRWAVVMSLPSEMPPVGVFDEFKVIHEGTEKVLINLIVDVNDSVTAATTTTIAPRDDLMPVGGVEGGWINILSFRGDTSTKLLPGAGDVGTISIVNPIPTLTTLDPASKVEDSGAFTLTVNGTKFLNGVSTVNWNGSPRTTTFVNSTQLTAAILAADVASAGTAQVTVVNAAPGGGTSNQVSFSIQPSGGLTWVRGDNEPNGNINVTDVIKFLSWNYQGGAVQCVNAQDFDNDGAIVITDAIAMLAWMFQGGAPPKAPSNFPGCDVITPVEAGDCENYGLCP